MCVFQKQTTYKCGFRVTVSYQVDAKHISEFNEECLKGSSNSSRLFRGMKSGLNGFSDFLTFKDLLLIYFDIKRKGMHLL